MKLIVAIAVLLVMTQSYEVEDTGVLVLHDADFPSILEEFNYILIEFYAPWCGHCKKLVPAYGEAAQALAGKNSPIKLAKVDATKDGENAGKYGVRGYPTIFFFINGTKMDFAGERTRDGIVSWLEKKILPATTEISSQEDLDKLKEQDNVNIVLFSQDEATVAKYSTLAATDDNNRYYVATGDLLTKYPETTVEIHRNFGEVLTHAGIEGRFSWWINKYSRPLVVDFDERTIGSIFRTQKSAIILFNAEKSDELNTVLETVAGQHEGEFLFTEILPGNEHFNRFAEFIKINVEAPKIVAILSGDRKKAVLAVDNLTPEALSAFLSSVEDKTATLHGLEEEIKEAVVEAAAAAAAAEETTEDAEAAPKDEEL